MKATIEDIWANHRNELINFLQEKGQGIYDETILEESIKDEKKELIDKACEWLKEYVEPNNDEFDIDFTAMIYDFRKAMEETII